MINNRAEFNELKSIEQWVAIPESVIPPNSITWVGASLLSSLNNEIDRFLVTYEDYTEKYQKSIPDRFGEAFIFGNNSSESYFNRDFEENLKLQKQILYSNTTPYSARSLASKREPINIMLKKTLARMDSTSNI